ncbi:hypothetical protein CHUAL_002794 [Chamberlinius hualienensis]
MDTNINEDELECENDATPSLRSNPRTVRKAIPLKLKSKSGKSGRGRGGGRASKKAEETDETTAGKSNIVVDHQISTDEPISSNNKNQSEIIVKIEEPKEPEKPPTFDMEQDIFKLEAPTFTTIDRATTEPIHNNSKLRWDHKVSLIGAKVLNPAIHVCNICSLPILLYGRMIPCKHVFCYECGVKSEKVCPRCHDKVNRVEHTGLGTIHICVYGGTKRNGSDGCNRTYLSHRDLQAHINHRHLKPAVPIAGTANNPNLAPTSTKVAVDGNRNNMSSSGTVPGMVSTHSHHHHNPVGSSAIDYRTQRGGGGHNRGHSDANNYRTTMNNYSNEVQHAYDQRTNSLISGVGSGTVAPSPAAVMSPYSLSVVPPTVSVSLQQQVVSATVSTVAGVQGVTYTTAIPVVSVQGGSNMPQARTNLITVPIHDDSNANAAADQPPRYPTGPMTMRPRFGTPPPAHYEDHSHLASMQQYAPSLWTQQQQQQSASQSQNRTNGPPPLIQPQQRFY